MTWRPHVQQCSLMLQGVQKPTFQDSPLDGVSTVQEFEASYQSGQDVPKSAT